MKVLSKIDIQNPTINSCLEIELLLYCVRPNIDNLVVDRIETLLKDKIDWSNLIQTAYAHGVIPLLHTRLNSICPNLVPDSALNEIRTLFGAIAQRNFFLTNELFKLLGILEEKKIVAVPYKGPVLAHLIYNNVALRQFGDLDILVQKQAIPTVKKLLIEQGYQPKVEMTETEEVAYLHSKTEHTYDFFHYEKKILVEIHWRIAPKYISQIEPKDLWSDLEPFSFAGTNISYLPIEDWLPILCVHGSRHMWARLAWLCDIATLIHNHPNLDWEKIFKQSNDWGCRRMLFLGIFLLHHLFGIVLPEKIWQIVKAEPTVSDLASKVYKQLFNEVKTSEQFLGKTLYQIQVRERLQDKLVYTQSFLSLFRHPR